MFFWGLCNGGEYLPGQAQQPGWGRKDLFPSLGCDSYLQINQEFSSPQRYQCLNKHGSRWIRLGTSFIMVLFSWLSCETSYISWFKGYDENVLWGKQKGEILFNRWVGPLQGRADSVSCSNMHTFSNTSSNVLNIVTQTGSPEVCGILSWKMEFQIVFLIYLKILVKSQTIWNKRLFSCPNANFARLSAYRQTVQK